MNPITGNVSIDAQNIMPIIKKWLYSDKDIFIREVVSNACDAITKLRMADFSAASGCSVRVEVDKAAKELRFIDDGVGMTEEEVKTNINQVAFSGAKSFLEEYAKDGEAENSGIIGHFGLGFYSVFMVADKVSIDTLSFREGAQAVRWESEDGMNFAMSESSRTTRGTTITLHVTEAEEEFLDLWRVREVLERYCSFMAYPIYLEEIKEEDVSVTGEGEEEKKEEKPLLTPINDTTPLYAKAPSECTDEDYKAFYRKVFHEYDDPLFWIHLNVDYPFKLKGILYFPKIKEQFGGIEGQIKLYSGQVFVADNIKEVIPEFLMLLKGVIDCPDLPLNVSRSALQNDGFAQKISDYISKKVAEKLAGMCKTDKENYDKYWDDISPFIKYGCLRDDKFCEKMTDYILFKDLDGKYHTLPEALEINAKDAEEESAADENGEKVEAEVVSDGDIAEADAAKDEAEDKEEEKKERTIYYVTDPAQQSQYVRMFRENGMQAFVLSHNIDQPFISQLEAKNEGIHFERIDANVQDALRADDEVAESEEQAKENGEKITKIVQKALDDDKLKVQLETLKDANVSSMLTVNEQTRRMNDMMKMYSMNGMDFGMDKMTKEGQTLILNAVHPLVKYVMEHEEGENTKLICEQLYDLAVLQNEPLTGDEMAKFVTRSNQIMMLLTEEK